MGYANLLQIGKGIHTRLFARTFIVKENESRVAFVSVDIGMIDTAIKNRVMKYFISLLFLLYENGRNYQSLCCT